jgi:carbamoyltransferase
MSRLVLGINSAHADSSAVLLGERGVIAAVAEERINRKKHCGDFPRLAILEVLRLAGATIADVTDIAVARDPRANLIAKGLFVAMNPIRAVPRAINRLKVHRQVSSGTEMMAEGLGTSADQIRAQFHQVEHHLAHISSAFYWSAFERATGLSVDATGDFATSMLATCTDRDVAVQRRTLWPHSLGIFYTALCQFIGFDRFGEEYKVMGLSAYGVNRFAREMRELVSYDQSRGIRLALPYFQHHVSADGFERLEDGEVTIPRLWSDRLRSLLGPPRLRSEPLSDRDRDIAASLQFRFEDIYMALIEDATRVTGIRDFVMAGGSVLNSVGNGRVLTERLIDRAYFHPAASDDGTAAGAALHVLHGKHGFKRTDAIRHAYWGTGWSDEEIEKALVLARMPFQRLDRSGLIATAADTIAGGKIVGWFQGREEWGPRALGNRSILCHPGWPDMKAILNARIKNREPFRPFAPAILKEKLGTCFLGEHEVPFMIVVYKVRPEWKDRLSAITHEDGTGRVQTVEREANPMYYDLIAAFEARTGIPVLLNTSFNENEPIVHTPGQAIDCFARTRMDALGIGSYWLTKEGREASPVQ